MQAIYIFSNQILNQWLKVHFKILHTRENYFHCKLHNLSRKRQNIRLGFFINISVGQKALKMTHIQTVHMKAKYFIANFFYEKNHLFVKMKTNAFNCRTHFLNIYYLYCMVNVQQIPGIGKYI